AGVWVDQFRQQDGAAIGRVAKPMVAPSQGVHIVVERDFLPTDHALLVPKTTDGRVLFAVPWLGKIILGTTDTPRPDLIYEPEPFESEVDFILNESARHLTRAPTRADVKSVWVGLRPLVRPPDDDGEHTKKLSREHTVLSSPSGLVTVTGGKWTTYRAMAEDVLDECFATGGLAAAPGGVTLRLPLVGADMANGETLHPLSAPQGLHSYGSERAVVAAMPGADEALAPGFTVAMVRFAVRHEYARTVEDVLARRARLLFLDAALAASVAPRVAALLQEEIDRPGALAAFETLARHYRHLPEAT
ncbi:MAG: FAD-dependent oxidoreductase, partial [Burkholderiaceae bacterium]